MRKRSSEPRHRVEGTVSAGYESVKKMFEDNFVAGMDDRSQLCVYVGQRVVVDLWGYKVDTSAIGHRTYTADTLTNVFSSTKSLTAICMAMLVEKGLLRYNDKISHHWPEFGQLGKDEVTVADLMRHEAGLAAFDTSIPPSDLLSSEIKQNSIGKVIEKQSQSFPPTGRRQYHAVTRGWIANEVVRRVHPEGITIGEFLSENVSKPLEARVFIGTDDTDYYPVKSMSVPFIVGQSFLPRKLGRALDQNFLDLCLMMNGVRKLVKDGKEKAPAITNMDLQGKIWNTPQIRSGEVPSANGNCNARGLARIAAVMAGRGCLGEVSLMSPETWEEMHLNATDGVLVQKSVKFTQGGVCKFEEEPVNNLKPEAEEVTLGRDGFYGWMGFGGSVFQWNPELNIGFSYVPTLLNWVDLVNNKARLLQGEVIKCVKREIANTVVVED